MDPNHGETSSSVFLLDKNTPEALYIGLSIWNDSQNWAIWSRSCPGDSGGRWDDLNPPPKGSEFFEAHKTPLKTDGYIGAEISTTQTEGPSDIY